MAAVHAALTWNPLEEIEPAGWTRNATTGRRRPDGDASQEYIRF